MIVQPSSLRPRSPLRRLLRVAAFVTPAVLLAAAVTAGMAGPKSPPHGSPPAGSEMAASPAPSGGDAATPTPATTLAATLPLDDPGFPAGYLSLLAMRPSEVLAARSSPDGAPGVLAVAGYLGGVSLVGSCDTPKVTSGAWCDRRAILADLPFGAPGTVGGFSAHLDVTIPAGVTVPFAPGPTGTTAGQTWVPVEVLGRFAETGRCDGGGPSCELGFAVERVVWAAGSRTAVTPLRAPGLGPDATQTPGAIAESPLLLLAVLAPSRTVGVLDPGAGAAAARLRPKGGLLWYVRELADPDADGIDEPIVRWALLDPAGKADLASGTSGLPPIATDAGTVPALAGPSIVPGPSLVPSVIPAQQTTAPG